MSDPQDKPQTHAHHDHAHHDDGACNHPLCNHGPVEPLTAEEEAIIEADPAAQSLSNALGYGFGFLKVIMAILVLFFILDRFTFVQEGEVMLISRFGKYLTDDQGEIRTFKPGTYYFVWPKPIERKVIISSSEEMSIDLDKEFWPRVDPKTAAKGPDALSPKNRMFSPGLDGYNLTGDLNILHSKWRVKYLITNYKNYVLSAESPEEMLRVLAMAAIVRNLASTDVDNAYHGANRSILFKQIQQDIEDGLRTTGGEARWGLTLKALEVGTVKVPGAAQGAFEAVTTAQSERTKLIENARSEANRITQQSITQAHQIRLNAERYKAEVVSRAAADAARVQDLIQKFPNDPEGLELYLSQYQHTQLQEAFKNAKLYIIRDGNTIFRTRPEPPDFRDLPAEKKEGQTP